MSCYCKCSVTLPHGVVGWPAGSIVVYISLSYSLTFLARFSFFLLILARSNYDHYARECDFGILKKKQNKKKQKKKSFGCVFN